MSTYGDILDNFKDYMGEVTERYFSAAQIDSFAHRGLKELCERGRYKDTPEEINIVNGTSEYAVSGDGYDVFRVEYDDEMILPITRDQLRSADRDWAYRTGLPRYYYLDEIYGSQDYLSVGLFETPGTDLTDGLRVWYHEYPDAPSSSSTSTELDVPDWASAAVLYYMLYMAYSAETRRQDFAVADFFYALFSELSERVEIRSNDRLPKGWVSGTPSGPSAHVKNRLPERITP